MAKVSEFVGSWLVVVNNGLRVVFLEEEKIELHEQQLNGVKTILSNRVKVMPINWQRKKEEKSNKNVLMKTAMKTLLFQLPVRHSKHECGSRM